MHTYIIINASYEGYCVEKSNTTLVFLLSNCSQVLKQDYRTHQLYVIFDGFCMITMIEFSCLYYELLFHKYFVAMKYRWICIVFIL